MTPTQQELIVAMQSGLALERDPYSFKMWHLIDYSKPREKRVVRVLRRSTVEPLLDDGIIYCGFRRDETYTGYRLCKNLRKGEK